MFANEVGSESRVSRQVTAADRTQESRDGGTSKGSVMINRKFSMRFIKTQDTVDLVSRRSIDRNRPEAIRSTDTGDDDGIILENLDIVFCKHGDAVVVAELSE